MCIGALPIVPMHCLVCPAMRPILLGRLGRNMEAQEINESRKVCSILGLIWRRPETGESIAEDEFAVYRGPTCCFHALFGMPCYAPYPAREDRATLVTPKQKRGNRSQTGSGEIAPRALGHVYAKMK